MKKILPMFKHRNNKGFALLFSVVILGVITIVTIAVNSIVQRGLDITTIGERSMEAFFAADAGMECAQYWDIKERQEGYFSGSGSSLPRCFGRTNIPVVLVSGMYQFELENRDADVCAVVRVHKDGLKTSIESYGKSTCDVNDRLIERRLRAEY